MITEEKYIETKNTFLKCVQIMKEYNKQPKTKKNIGRPKIKFSIDEKINNLNIIFNSKPFYTYSEIIEEIKNIFRIGGLNSKKLLIELNNEKLISKAGPRGKYEKSF